MLVQDIMTKQVVAIGPDMPIADVHALMKQRNIRHFPILETSSAEDGISGRAAERSELVGIVSDRDIRLVGSEHPSAPPGVRFKDEVRRIMATPVITAHPLEPIEEAAKMLREHKIGALPVVQSGALVGIVTAIDFLEALVKMTGVYGPSTRLELELDRRPGALAKLIDRIASAGYGVSSVLSTQADAETVQVVLRVATIDGRGLAERLGAEGFSVLWPKAK